MPFQKSLCFRNVLKLASLCLVGALILFGWSSLAFAEQHQALPSWKDCPDCPEMITLPAGSFLKKERKRSGSKAGSKQETKRVNVTAISVSRTEISREDWRVCVREGGCDELRENQVSTEDDHPVVEVNWYQANEYAAWLSAKTGKNYRLPNTNEWEYAARGGTDADFYWGEESAEVACDYANLDDVSYKVGPRNENYERMYRFISRRHKCDDGFRFVAPVASFEPNAFGLFDTGGNVWEWTLDCWNELLPARKANVAKDGAPACEKLEIRGGSYRLGVRSASATSAAGRRPDFSNVDIGFRVVREEN